MSGNEMFSHFSRVHGQLDFTTQQQESLPQDHLAVFLCPPQQHSSNTVITITLSAHIHGATLAVLLAKVCRGVLVVCFAGNGTCLLPVLTWFPVHSPGGKYTLLRTFPGCQHRRMRNIQCRSNMRPGTKFPFPE